MKAPTLTNGVFSHPLVVRVRDAGGTFTARLAGKTASCSMGAPRAVFRVLEKVYQDNIRQGFDLTEQKSTEYGIRLFEVTPKRPLIGSAIRKAGES